MLRLRTVRIDFELDIPDVAVGGEKAAYLEYAAYSPPSNVTLDRGAGFTVICKSGCAWSSTYTYTIPGRWMKICFRLNDLQNRDGKKLADETVDRIQFGGSPLYGWNDESHVPYAILIDDLKIRIGGKHPHEMATTEEYWYRGKLCGVLADTPDYCVWGGLGTQKVFREQPPPERTRNEIEIKAARNEWECFQIVVRPKKMGPNWAELEFTDLRHEELDWRIGRRNITWNPVHFAHITERTHLESLLYKHPVDQWRPDALMPLNADEVLQRWNEKANKYESFHEELFPPVKGGKVNCSTVENYPLYVTVRIPSDAKAGWYRGEAAVKTDYGTTSIPVRLKVWDFVLPDLRNQHLTVAAIVDGGGATLFDRRPHAVRDPDWYRFAAERRISAATIPPDLPKPGRQGNSWSRIDFGRDDDLNSAQGMRKYLLDDLGMRMNLVKVSGQHHDGLGKFGDYDPASQYEDWKGCIASYVKQTLAHFAKDMASRGWDKTTCYAVYAEVNPNGFNDHILMSKITREAARQAGLGHKLKIQSPVAQMFSALHGYIDVWVINGACFAPAQWPKICERRAAGEEVGTYNYSRPSACEHVCYDITETRAVRWHCFKYDIAKSLHWTFVWAYHVRDTGNPWTSHYDFGSAVRIYPTTAGPCSSIRIENTREGIEDYEYLWLLKQLKGETAAKRYCSQIRKDFYEWETNPERLYEVRQQIAEEIEEALGARGSNE